MNKISVLVTGIGAGSHGEQIVKALKLVNDFKLEIFGTDVSKLSTGKKLVDKFFQVPYVTDKTYEEIIFDIIKKNNIQFIFHGSEPELRYLSNNREKFEIKGIKHPLNSKDVINLCMNKHKTYVELEKLGIDVPKYKKIDSLKDIESIDFYPVVLKPSTGSGGSSNVSIALDKYDCELLVKLSLKRNIDLIAQQYIGSHLEEYTIGVSSNKFGEVLGSVIVKRFVTNTLSTSQKFLFDNNIYIISSGISQGFVCHDENLQKQAENIAKLLKSTGPLNIQARVVNDKLLVFEINPRLSGTTSLRALAGYNEPYSMIKDQILGQKWNCTYKDHIILRSINEIIIK